MNALTATLEPPLTAAEAARALGCSVATLRRMKLPSYPVGIGNQTRYAQHVIRKYIKDNTRNASLSTGLNAPAIAATSPQIRDRFRAQGFAVSM